MFLGDATFEVIEKPNPTNPQLEGLCFQMRLVSVNNIREVPAVEEGRYATYAEIVGTLTRVLPDWAAIAGQMPGMSRQYHILRFESRGEIDGILNSLKD